MVDSPFKTSSSVLRLLAIMLGAMYEPGGKMLDSTTFNVRGVEDKIHLLHRKKREMEFSMFEGIDPCSTDVHCRSITISRFI